MQRVRKEKKEEDATPLRAAIISAIWCLVFGVWQNCLVALGVPLEGFFTVHGFQFHPPIPLLGKAAA